MFDRLNDIEKRYDEIEKLLYDGEVIGDVEKYTALLKEQKSISEVALAYKQYRAALAETQEARAIAKDPSADRELKDMAAEIIESSAAVLAEYEQKLKTLLLPKDEDDDKNVIMEIRAGTGGDEGALFAGVLYRMYCMYAEKHGWKISLLYCSETQLGGFKEISFSVSGEGAYSRLKFESGVHRVQRVPETESQGRIHTSAATVAVLPEADEVDVKIDPADLQIDTFRSSGAGGQHINKTESAVRITHLPTGIVVECQDERSQHKNRDKAMKVLRSKLLQSEREKQADRIADTRRSQVGSGDRSEKIRTYNFPQSRVSDHRAGVTLYKLEQFVNGDMDEIIDALIAMDTADRLREGSDQN